MKFRRFNDRGLEEFRRQLLAIKADPAAHLSPPLLTDPTLTEPLDPQVEAVPVPFNNRMDFARWLYDASDRGSRIPRSDPGFWAWLTAALFDQVCPKDHNTGKCKVGSIPRYIPESNDWKRRYRHLLSNPFDIFMLHRDAPSRAIVVLVGSLHKPGELVEQVSARRDFVSCPGTMGLASFLFVDPATQTRRHGASGEVARRLGKLMNQYHRTWDLPVVEPGSFSERLPREFRKFVNLATNAREVVSEP